MSTIAFLAGGQLYLRKDDGEPELVESKFVKEYRERAASLQRKNDWKRQGSGAAFMGMGPTWYDENALSALPAHFTGVAPGPRPNTLVYAISTGAVGGVFIYDVESGEEERLFHSAEHRVEKVTTSPDHGVIACTLTKKGGPQHVAVMAPDGSMLDSVTSGDVIDSDPSWLPAGAIEDEERPHRLVYSSAGIGRDQGGLFVGLAPAAIVELDPEHGELSERKSDEARDLLLPQVDSRGRLYGITRPYQEIETPSTLGAVTDALAFPFRLLMAIFGWLNIFSLRNTGKPLARSGSSRSKHADLQQAMISRNLQNASQEVDEEAEKAMRKWLKKNTLVRFDGEREEVLARGVRTYSLDGDGLIYSDGYSVHRVGEEKRTELFRHGRPVEKLVVL